MKPICQLCWVLFIPMISFAQTTKSTFKKLILQPKAVEVHMDDRVIRFTAYPNDIIQTTIETSNYKGEQISNAVIEKTSFRPPIIRNDQEVISMKNGKHIVILMKVQQHNIIIILNLIMCMELQCI